MARVIIRDANGNIAGNPKGYKNHSYAMAQADNRLYEKLEAIAMARYPDMPPACVTVYTLRWELV